MRKMLANKKKKGFTLIEMVAVVAIIGILAAILVPKVTGYMKEAKKTAVIDQARKVSQAYETAVMKEKHAGVTLTNQATTEVNKNTTMKSLVDGADLSKIGTATVQQCINITKGADFTLTTGDVLDTSSVATSS
ncbi:MAG: type II secretion system protein [Clostridium sp.]|uniref:type II secretion system protein n=1 Tax=Clostridium sp. TaxID=1506 RepID=UPI003F30DA21